jgi:hypothetical protein
MDNSLKEMSLSEAIAKVSAQIKAQVPEVLPGTIQPKVQSRTTQPSGTRKEVTTTSGKKFSYTLPK